MAEVKCPQCSPGFLTIAYKPNVRIYETTAYCLDCGNKTLVRITEKAIHVIYANHLNKEKVAL